MLGSVSGSHQLCRTLGIKKIRQIVTEGPSWCFWINDAPGVYHLELEEAKKVRGGDVPLYSAVFTLKCYPYAHVPVFGSFSFEEQCYIESFCFDSENAPESDFRERIPDSLFHVAMIEYTFDRDETFALFSFESLDRLQVSFRERTLHHYEKLNKTRLFEKGEIDREVPGIKIGYPFFDLLLCIHAYAGRHPPSRVRIGREKGYRYLTDRSGRCQRIDCPDTRVILVDVIFTRQKEEGHRLLRSKSLYPLRIEAPVIIFDKSFHRETYYGDTSEVSRLTPLNRSWWSLAAPDETDPGPGFTQAVQNGFENHLTTDEIFIRNGLNDYS